VTSRAAVLGGVALLALGGLGWAGVHWLDADAQAPAVSRAVPAAAAPASGAPDEVETVDEEGVVDAGTTPMAQRVAVIGLLNKRNGESRELTLKPGQAVRYGDTVVRLRACEQTAPWEPERLTGAFVQLVVRGSDAQWRRAFSGWLFKERPNLNVVQHPVYDVWTKSCTMSFPASGPDTVTLSAPAAAARSTAKKSAPASGENAPEAAPAATASPSAAESDDT
jgi:hypothetical protein